MTLNPVEVLNVFDPRLQTELRSRSFSKNLVQVRTPFLRFTTAADMSTFAAVENSPSAAANYNGYKYFTLGLHGWDNKNYKAADLYGTQAENGLVVGTTYKSGEQKLVFTHRGDQRTSYAPSSTTPGNTGGAQQLGAVTITAGGDPAQNFPPPGITSAKVERLRSGNVLKFTIEAQCYTQEQLEVLDMLCFIPGMTCILEWGTVTTTPTSTNPTLITLDFKNSNVDEDIRIALRGSRKSFVDRWCVPNKYNYDWAVANIANVKTTLQNDVYKITVVAYGRADNLMYISAYATSNAVQESNVKEDEEGKRAVTEYFKSNGQFSRFLKDQVESQYNNGNVIRFYDPVYRAEKPEENNTSSDTNTTNDLGLEDTYFISFGYFIDQILNIQVKEIINSAMNDDTKIQRILSPLVDGDDIIKVGYNAHLRSTNPETMIIFNSTAIALAKKRANTAGIKSGLISSLQRMDGNGNYSYNSSNSAVIGGGSDPGYLDADKIQPVYDVMKANKFGKNLSSPQSEVSGTVPLSTGVWLNSKGIQSAFLNARTIMEGLEALLRNVNAATENYWDLKLFFDDDRQEFRILDDNTREVDIKPTDTIYEFNRKLSSVKTETGTDVLGPDVLDIQLSTDYPKMLFSQLAVSGINGGNLLSRPERKDADFVGRTSVKDIFSRNTQAPLSVTSPLTAAQRGQVDFPSKSIDQTANIVATALYGSINTTGTPFGNIKNNLSSFATNSDGQVRAEIVQFLQEIFSIKTFLSVEQASRYRGLFDNYIRQGLLTAPQADQLRKLLAIRTKRLIDIKKNEEQAAIEALFKFWNDKQSRNTKLPGDLITNEDLNSSVGDNPNLRQFTKIEESRRELKRQIDQLVGVTPAGEAAGAG